MFKRNRLIIIEEPEYGLGPKVLPTTDGFGFITPRFTDKPDPNRGDKALATIRKSASAIRNRGKIQLPVEMPFDGPRSAESK